MLEEEEDSGFVMVTDDSLESGQDRARHHSGNRRHYDSSKDLGLTHPRAMLYCGLWYLFSGLTLYLNKYIVALGMMHEAALASTQMGSCLVLGYLHMTHTLGPFKATSTSRVAGKAGAMRPMAVVGGLRFSTVILGMFALDYLPVSFTETVKSTAPAFTVILSRIILGEQTGTFVKCSLIPVMGGLALCSANELNFHLIGFMAALGTNLSECLQNVLAKRLVSSSQTQKYSPAEVQFYTSKCSFVVQIPVLIFMVDWVSLAEALTSSDKLIDTGHVVHVFLLYLSNGVFFHYQTISAFALIDYISPVTHSVANTGKRALLIWLSVILFGNPVTFLSGLGTLVVIVGVLIYNKAREVDASRLKLHSKATDM